MEQVLWDQVERYLHHLEVDLSASPNTVAAYRNDLTQFYQYLLTPPPRASDHGHLNEPPGEISGWGAVTRARLVGFVVALKERQYRTTTIARKIAALKSFFHYLHTRGVIPVDPTETLDSPRIDKNVPHSLSHSEVTVLLGQPNDAASPDGIRDNAMLRLLYSTGLRVSEMVALNVDDVDLASGYVRCVNRNGRERIIPLDADAVEALREYLDTARVALIHRRDEPALFVNRRGDRLTRQGFWLILKDRARQAGLPDNVNVTPQALRHSFAIRLLHDNTDLRAVQELLGHANITTTQIYTQFAERSDRADEKLVAKPQMVSS